MKVSEKRIWAWRLSLLALLIAAAIFMRVMFPF